MDSYEYRNEYLKILEEYENPTNENYILNDINVHKILSRGLHGSDFSCASPILLTGINPSYKEIPPDDVWPHEMRLFNFKDATHEKGNRYWTKKSQKFGKLCDEIAYLDLFPIRETHQNNGFEKAFRHYEKFRASILSVTQKIIEREIKPKLIINANRGSIYYWGIKPRCKDLVNANDYINPWMGYKVERVISEQYNDLPDCMLQYGRLENFPLYKIVGLMDNIHRINSNEISNTNLKGSYIVEYVMEYRNGQNKILYNETDWEEISNWAVNH